MRRDTRQALRSRVVFVNAPLERSESDSSARIGVSILRKISIGTVQIFQYRYLSKYRYLTTLVCSLVVCACIRVCVCVYLCVFASVCVRERERERECVCVCVCV